jgi:chemotaxis protein methyltransferase CheR
VNLLLEAVYQQYGFDFRHYARASLKRRLHKQMRDEGLPTLSALTERVLHDERCVERLLLTLSITVTSMFRDPQFYLALRNDVLPLLRTYPSVRVWIAGCSSGEEVYSVAILLEEEGLYERSRIYATDMNDKVLARARAGQYPLERMRTYTENYQRTAPKASFSEYYQAGDRYAVLVSRLREHVVFSQHDLATDGPFNEFQLILCRNVMIYFDQELQARVVGLFLKSLRMFGVLGLGKQESLKFNEQHESFELLDDQSRLYRRIR